MLVELSVSGLYVTSFLMDKVVLLNDSSVNEILGFLFFYSDLLRTSILLPCLGQSVHYTKSPHPHNNGRNLKGGGGSKRACAACTHVPPPAAEQVINSEHCPPVNSSPSQK